MLAGFVFGGIVVVLSTREGRRGRETARALKLLFSAFFGLVVTAYLFADQAADTDCLRAFAEENLAGALLGTFALVLIVSLTWLVLAYRLHAEGTLGFFRSLIYFASAFVVLLLCTSSYSYLQYVLPQAPPPFIAYAIYGSGGLGFVIAIPRASWAGAAHRARNWIAPFPEQVSTDRSAISVRDSAVEWCARSALGFLAIAAIADALVLSTPNDWWSQPRPALHYVNALGSLLLPLVILFLALRAIAPDQEISPGPSGSGSERHPAPAPSGVLAEQETAKIVVDRDMLLRRLEGYGVDHYTILHNTIASVALAVAGLSAANLAGSREFYRGSWPRSPSPVIPPPGPCGRTPPIG